MNCVRTERLFVYDLKDFVYDLKDKISSLLTDNAPNCTLIRYGFVNKTN